MSYKRESAISLLDASAPLANIPPLRADKKAGVILFRIVFRPVAGRALSEATLAGSFQSPGRGVFRFEACSAGWKWQLDGRCLFTASLVDGICLGN